MSLSLPIPLSKFNASIQILLRQQIAVAADLNADYGWALVNMTVQALHRRLLYDGVSVDVTITLTNATAANATATALATPDRLNEALASVGLPPATITSAPAVIVVFAALPPAPTSSSAAGFGELRTLPCAAALVAAMMAVGAGGRRPAS